ncbi:hypothetical protein FZI91_17300 [Mycobacterium sp. CBMA271]|uniref:hypothetical protein n=1 Tax=unclassified Mycobacteroides TaxID=2618759 RepID=UPI0012DFC4A8|nr:MULTISPECIES: hypothetical protein [unclassified Mycobacteroides]MUM18074.1 hypothetical protein [Mycobacteroides sp. CBMA 326]MUM23442.1 hypothetical protein [Mycobacteroides sp. CBMA 271]
MGRHNVRSVLDEVSRALPHSDLGTAAPPHLTGWSSDFVWAVEVAETTSIVTDPDFVPTPPPWFRA